METPQSHKKGYSTEESLGAKKLCELTQSQWTSQRKSKITMEGKQCWGKTKYHIPGAYQKQ